jgi:anti-sigma B factor antagonist
MEISEGKKGGVCILTVQEKRLDAKLAVSLRKVIQEKCEEGHHSLVLDLGNVAFMDSSGLGALVGAYKLAGKQGRLVLANVTTAVREVLQLTRMDRVFKIYESADQAASDLVSV